MPIPLSAPDITEAEIAAVTAVLRTPHLSLGPELANFESALAEYHSVPHAIAVIQDGRFVFVVKPNSTVEVRPVRGAREADDQAGRRGRRPSCPSGWRPAPGLPGRPPTMPPSGSLTNCE